jgi:hypothetical protein
MGFITSLIAAFQHKTTISSHREANTSSREVVFLRPNAFQNSHLRKLPTELLQYIASSLPPVSAALFSLSCRYIYSEVGYRHLKALATSNHDTLAFLERIAHDIPGHIVCEHCRRLHSMRNARQYLMNNFRAGYGPERLCSIHDENDLVKHFIYKNFSSIIFKMAMTNYYEFGHNLQTRELLEHMSSDVLNCRTWSLYRREETQCRIRDDSLLTQKRMAIRDPYTDFLQEFIHEPICKHLDFMSDIGCSRICVQDWTSTLGRERRSVFACTRQGATPSNYPEAKLEQCLRCRTEYKISVEHDEGCDVSIKIDIWKDLGGGLGSEEWKDHICLDGILQKATLVDSTQVVGAGLASLFQDKDLNE